eukprot:s363_g30.t1
MFSPATAADLQRIKRGVSPVATSVTTGTSLAVFWKLLEGASSAGLSWPEDLSATGGASEADCLFCFWGWGPCCPASRPSSLKQCMEERLVSFKDTVEVHKDELRFVKGAASLASQGVIHYLKFLRVFALLFLPVRWDLQCIVVAQVEERFLAAFPAQVWHRQISKRVLPAQLLSKPALVETACSALSNREEIVEELKMKVWVGYITADSYSLLNEVTDPATPVDYAFAVGGERDYLPYSEFFVAVLAEHFAFLSAESGVGEGGSGSQPAAEVPPDTRVASPETQRNRVVDNLQELLASMQRQTLAQQKSRVTFSPKPKIIPACDKRRQADSAGSKFPLLDPAVVAAALNAGVSEGNLEEMQRLISSGQSGSKKLREPALRSHVKKADAGGGGCGSRRAWFGAAFLTSSVGNCSLEAHGFGLSPSSRAAEESPLLKDRFGFGQCWRLFDFRYGRGHDMEASSCSKTCSPAGPVGVPRGSVQDSGEVAVGGLDQSNTSPWNASSYVQCSSMGGAPKLHLCHIEDFSICCMVCGWHSGQLSEGQVCTSSCSGRYHAPSVGPAGHRSRQLESSSRAQLRAAPTTGDTERAHFAQCERRRVALQPTLRSKVGRGDAESLERCRRLSAKEADSWEKGGVRRHGKYSGNAQAKGEGKSQGSAGASGCMNYVGKHAVGPLGVEVEDDTKKVSIPGARAPTVKVPGLLNSMLRLMAKYTNKLSGFLHSLRCNKPRPRCEVTSLGPLWPIPVPYPEVFGKDPATGTSWRKRRLVLQIVVLDWLYLGRPAVCPGLLWLGQPLSSRQWKRVKLLETLSEDGNSIFEVDAVPMARAALKTESSSDQLDALHRALACTAASDAAPYGGVTSPAPSAWREDEDDEFCGLAGLYGMFEGDLTGEPFSVAKPIQADRVQFVGRPGFDPMPYFDAVTAKACSCPLDCVREEPGVEPPKVSVHATSDSQVLRLSGALKDEILTLATLCTLSVVNLRAQTACTLRATDASDWGMAAVSCEIPSLVFKEEWRKAYPRAVHINIGESNLREESRLATNLMSARVAYALDSQVALGALVKGRASSKALNGELMKSIPILLGSDLYAAYGFWPSKLNRADGPTRSSVPDPPDQDLPWWWNEVNEGQYERFDQWLSSLQAKLQPYQREAPARDSLPVELQTGRRERHADFLARKTAGKLGRLGKVHSSPSRPRALQALSPAALEILRSFSSKPYSGKAGVARALVRGGAPWVITFEITRSAAEDVCSAENRRRIIRLIQLHAVPERGPLDEC